jgi:hypothetical protein
MKRTVEGQRRDDGFVLVDRRVTAGRITAIGGTVVAIATAIIAILRCILEAGVL